VTVSSRGTLRAPRDVSSIRRGSTSYGRGYCGFAPRFPSLGGTELILDDSMTRWSPTWPGLLLPVEHPPRSCGGGWPRPAIGGGRAASRCADAAAAVAQRRAAAAQPPRPHGAMPGTRNPPNPGRAPGRNWGSPKARGGAPTSWPRPQPRPAQPMGAGPARRGARACLTSSTPPPPPPPRPKKRRFFFPD